jgi:hypothetical protein
MILKSINESGGIFFVNFDRWRRSSFVIRSNGYERCLPKPITA